MTDTGKKDPDSTQPVPVRPRSSHKLWAILLVLDCVFVIIFGGAVSAKVYQHWQAPPPAPPVAPKPARKPAATPAAKAAAKSVPKPQATKAPQKKSAKKAPAAKKAAAPKKAKKNAQPAKGIKPPRPSLLSEAPKPRAAPKPQSAKPSPKKKTSPKTAAAKTPPPPKAERPKAFPVDFKIKAPGAKSVQLTGMFLVRTGGKKDMVAKGDGLWTLRLYLVPDTYQYLFIVDGKKVKDPENPEEKLGHSVRTVGKP